MSAESREIYIYTYFFLGEEVVCVFYVIKSGFEEQSEGEDRRASPLNYRASIARPEQMCATRPKRFNEECAPGEREKFWAFEARRRFFEARGNWFRIAFAHICVYTCMINQLELRRGES